jgi:hypothetical protein
MVADSPIGDITRLCAYRVVFTGAVPGHVINGEASASAVIAFSPATRALEHSLTGDAAAADRGRQRRS